MYRNKTFFGASRQEWGVQSTVEVEYSRREDGVDILDLETKLEAAAVSLAGHVLAVIQSVQSGDTRKHMLVIPHAEQDSIFVPAWSTSLQVGPVVAARWEKSKPVLDFLSEASQQDTVKFHFDPSFSREGTGRHRKDPRWTTQRIETPAGSAPESRIDLSRFDWADAAALNVAKITDDHLAVLHSDEKMRVAKLQGGELNFLGDTDYPRIAEGPLGAMTMCENVGLVGVDFAHTLGENMIVHVNTFDPDYLLCAL